MLQQQLTCFTAFPSRPLLCLIVCLPLYLAMSDAMCAQLAAPLPIVLLLSISTAASIMGESALQCTTMPFTSV